jgi:hypothetical protein
MNYGSSVDSMNCGVECRILTPAPLRETHSRARGVGLLSLILPDPERAAAGTSTPIKATPENA